MKQVGDGVYYMTLRVPLSLDFSDDSGKPQTLAEDDIKRAMGENLYDLFQRLPAFEIARYIDDWDWEEQASACPGPRPEGGLEK